MLQQLRKYKGQTTLEYAILVVIIIGALLALQVYIKRGVQGRLKSATDDVGEQYSMAEGANYYKKVTTTSNTTDNSVAGVSETKLRADTITTTNTSINLNAAGEDFGQTPTNGTEAPPAN
jgi:Flp pilus assembly pilin Flp